MSLSSVTLLCYEWKNDRKNSEGMLRQKETNRIKGEREWAQKRKKKGKKEKKSEKKEKKEGKNWK